MVIIPVLFFSANGIVKSNFILLKGAIPYLHSHQLWRGSQSGSRGVSEPAVRSLLTALGWVILQLFSCQFEAFMLCTKSMGFQQESKFYSLLLL